LAFEKPDHKWRWRKVPLFPPVSLMGLRVEIGGERMKVRPRSFFSPIFCLASGHSIFNQSMPRPAFFSRACGGRGGRAWCCWRPRNRQVMSMRQPPGMTSFERVPPPGGPESTTTGLRHVCPFPSAPPGVSRPRPVRRAVEIDEGQRSGLTSFQTRNARFRSRVRA